MLSTHALLKRSYAYAMVRVWLKDNCCDINAQAHSAAYKHPLDYVLFDTHHYNSKRELRQRGRAADANATARTGRQLSA